LNIQSPDFKYTHVEIYSVDGKRIVSKELAYTPENKLPISLPEGVYILNLNSLKEKRSVNFIVK
jgi:hypothetical protein